VDRRRDRGSLPAAEPCRAASRLNAPAASPRPPRRGPSSGDFSGWSCRFLLVIEQGIKPRSIRSALVSCIDDLQPRRLQQR
jgi:hypothetical protein